MEASHFPSDSGPGWELIVQATESPCPWWQFEVFFFSRYSSHPYPAILSEKVKMKGLESSACSFYFLSIQASSEL